MKVRRKSEIAAVQQMVAKYGFRPMKHEPSVMAWKANKAISDAVSEILAETGSRNCSVHQNVSEEQPWPKENQVMKPAPHRATIAMLDCRCGCGTWYVTIDGNPVPQSDSELMWRGTEAEAKAKLESLSKGGE